jgi:hypothetical protein
MSDASPQPTSIDRPEMPDGYGVPAEVEGLLAWAEVEALLVSAKVYWMATTRPDSRPHVVPRWGAWVDGVLLYDGSPATRHARNLAANSACVLHLESGSEVVILEGDSGPSAPPGPELGRRLSAEIGRKYKALGYAPAADAWEGPDAGGLCRFSPRKGLAWTSFPTDTTRFRWTD